jgi:aryl-alcohol dehydrogenase-like predicted oxidoreductase
MTIRHRILGKTGLSVSVLGFGGSEVGYQEVAQKTVDAILGRALDAGVNLIDTAECYADSEGLIGRALGQRRSEVVLMTKCGHAMLESAADRAGGFARSEWDPAMLSASIDRSLKRLGTDYVDVIQFHSPGREVLDNDDAIAALQRAREAGKARFIGCSIDGDDAAHAIEMDVFDTLQISVNVADQEAIDLVLPKAIERGIGVIAKRPIANAVWKNRRAPSDWYTRPYWDRLRTLDFDFLRGDVEDAVSTALSFTLSTPGIHCAIVGTTRPENVTRNVELVSTKELDRAAYERIRSRWREVARRDWVGQR